MLDNFRETAITWDKANRKVYEPLRVSAGDNKGRKLSVQVVNGGVIESLFGASLSLFWETKDKAYKGLDAFTAVDATKGEFEIYYTTGMLSNEGTLNANLVLVDASGRVVSEPFTIAVFKGIDDDAIQSSDSFTALTAALAQVGTINNKADRAELLALESTFEQNKVSVDQQLQQKEVYITYKDFGINSDIKYFNPSNKKYFLDKNFTQEYNTDDGILIKKAHEYASEKDLDLIVTGGHYVIRETRDIPITTNTNFGRAVFHIDERYSELPVFRVKSEFSEKEVYDVDRVTLLEEIKTKSNVLKSLENYKNHIVFVSDTTRTVGKRNGVGGFPMRDFFYVREGGRIEGDISWDFENITNVSVKEVENNAIIISGGYFLLNGVTSSSEFSYVYTGFLIERSRTKINNQFIGMDGVDETLKNSQGFFYPNKVYAFELDSIDVLPRLNNSGNGTYGIGGDTVIKFILKNISGNSSGAWGVMGTNWIKNLTVKDSHLSRVDVHFFAWNVKIEDTEVDTISLSGGGLLRVKNVKMNGNSVVVFRSDYGATWNGDIVVEDVVVNVTDNSSTKQILSFMFSDYDYGYTIYHGHNINIKNVVFDFKKFIFSGGLWVFNFSNNTKAGSYRVHLPENVHVENLKIKNSNIGYKLFSIVSPQEMRVNKNFDYSKHRGNVNITPNAQWWFENIAIHELLVDTDSTSGTAHAFLGALSNEAYNNYSSFVPEIYFNKMKNLNVSTWGSISILRFNDVEINMLDANQGGSGRSRIYISMSDIKPRLSNIGVLSPFQVGGCELDMINVKLFMPKLNGVDSPKASYILYLNYQNNTDVYLIGAKYVMVTLDKGYEDKIREIASSTHLSKLDEAFKEMRLNTFDFSSTKFF